MNPEQKRQNEVIIQLLCVLVFSVLYSMGGNGHGLYLRRIIGSLWITGCMWYFSGIQRSLFTFPALALALSLPYTDKYGFAMSILLRMAFGGTCAFSACLTLAFQRKWRLVAFSTVLGAIAYICMGALGFSFDPRSEETILAVLIVLIPMLSVSRVKK